jgi:hypothetical protein
VSFDRGLIRPILGVLAALLVLVGLIWATGGLRPARAVGRPVPAGEPIDLERWSITIAACEYVDRSLLDYQIEPTARVLLRITNLTKRTIQEPTDGVFTAELGGRPLGTAAWAPGQTRGSLNFDPDVEVRVAYEFALPADADLAADLTVLVHHERNRDNFVLGENWAAEDPAAAVTMSCPDHPLGRS